MTSPAARNTGWYDDRDLVAALPWHWRAYAAYLRLAANRRTGFVRGGSFMFRRLRRWTRLLGLPDTARVPVGGRTVWVDLLDQRCLWVFDELRGGSPESRVLAQLLRAGDTFLDVGANHGSFAIIAAEHVGPSGRIVAVEPQPRLSALIERSLADQAAAPFEVHQVALGRHPADGVLHIPGASSGAANLFRPLERCSGQTIAVPIRRLDDYLPWPTWPGRLTIKLDVEGSEPDVLLGARELLLARQPPILLEISPETARLAGRTVLELIRTLRLLGYARFAELDAFPRTIGPEQLDLTRQRNVVALWGGDGEGEEGKKGGAR
jgi:FkbM family methyltransferase